MVTILLKYKVALNRWKHNNLLCYMKEYKIQMYGIPFYFVPLRVWDCRGNLKLAVGQNTETIPCHLAGWRAGIQRYQITLTTRYNGPLVLSPDKLDSRWRHPVLFGFSYRSQIQQTTYGRGTRVFWSDPDESRKGSGSVVFRVFLMWRFTRIYTGTCSLGVVRMKDSSRCGSFGPCRVSCHPRIL